MSNIYSFGALAPFRVRSFRFQWPADLLTSWAFEMETLILGWYVLVETGSVLLLTVFGALQFVGSLIAPMLGVVSDRIGHRTVLFAMRAVYSLCAASLMVPAIAHSLSPLFVLVVVAVNGLVRPSDMGMRGALIAHTMRPNRLIGALSVSRTTQDSARIAGALTGAGLFAAFGMGPAYLVITCAYALGAVLTLGVGAPPQDFRAADPAQVDPSPWHDLKEGIAHVWTTPRLLIVMLCAFLLNLTAYPISQGLMPYVARDIFHLDQTGLGYLLASFATGAVVGSLVLSLAGDVRMPRVMIVSSMAWYALLLIFAQVESLAAGLVCLLLAGFAQSINMVCLTVILMRTSDARFRGRVMGVRMLAIYGLPVGLIAAGALVGRIGFRATASLYALTGLALILAIALKWRADVWQGKEEPAQA